MLIFGWGTRQRVVETGRFRCPVCQSETTCSRLRQSRWFSLFFVPIFPISGSKDVVRCDQCQTAIQMEALTGQPADQTRQLSYVALIGMLLGLLSFLTICVFFVSIPLAITAVIMGHIGLQTVRQNRPRIEGGWQAITALVAGYSALCFSLLIVGFFLFAPRWFPRDNSGLSRAGNSSGQTSDDGPMSITDSTNEAFKNAEYEIAAKRDKPLGRGNSEQAIEMATQVSEHLKEISDVVITTSGRKPVFQLSGGDYLTYCELHEDRCLFLVHVPSYRKFSGDAKKAIAQVAWATAQATVAGKLPANAKLAVGMRGVLTYGDIMLGTCPASTDEEFTPFKAGKTEDLLSFFEDAVAKPATNTLATRERSEPTTTTDLLATNSTIGNKDAAGTANDNSPVTPAPAPAPVPAAAATTEETMLFNPLVLPARPPVPQTETSLPDANSNSQPVRKRNATKTDFKNQINVRLVQTLENEMWGYTSLAFHPDGKWLVGGKMDQMLTVFAVETGQSLTTLEKLNELGQVKALAFDATGEYLIAGGYSGQTLSWKISPDGSLSGQAKLHRFDNEIQHLITSRKFPFFMGSSRRGSIAWQSFGSKTSQPRLLQEFPKNVHALWLPETGGEALATDGMKLVKFSLRDGSIVESQNLGFKNLRFAAFSLSGQRLVLANHDSCHLVDLENANATRTVKLPRGEMMHSLIFHPNERWFAAGVRGNVAIFDYEKAELIAYADTDSTSYQAVLAISPDGKQLATTAESARSPIQIFRLSE